jgi:hypothetical protein
MLKIENGLQYYFLKIKEKFSVKGKMFLLTIILRHTKHCKIRKSFSLKPFYVERNRALLKRYV